jgi:hypothetical protein
MASTQRVSSFVYLFLLCIAFSGHICPVQAVGSSSQPTGPTVSNDQPDVAAILASAHEAAIKISDPIQRYDSLIKLAETCLRVQDKKTAAKALSEAKTLIPSIKIQDYKVLTFIKLSIQADSIDEALASAQAAPGLLRIEALGYVGENMAQNGNIAGAKKILQYLSTITETDVTPASSSETEMKWAPGFGPSFSNNMAAARCQIGTALAAKNDLQDAIPIVKSVHNNICIIDLLGAIAAAEQNMGQTEASRQTLADISAIITNEAPKNNFYIEWVRRAATTFGINDDLARAKAVIETLPEVPGAYTEQQIRDMASSQVIEWTAKKGDILHASHMLILLSDSKRSSAYLAIAQAQLNQRNAGEAHASLELAYKSELNDTQADLATMKDVADRATEFKRSEVIRGHVETIVAIGKAMAQQGDVNYAKSILLSAYTCILYTPAPVNPTGMFMTVVSSQIDIGAFTDALTTANKIEAIDRMQFIIRLLKEEVKHNDAQALRETVPAALKTAQEAPPLAARGQAALAETLASAGYKDEAQKILGTTEKNAQNSVGWQKMDQLAALKNTQSAMGDETGKAETTAQMQEETKRFDAEVVKATADIQAKSVNQINIPAALQLMRQAQAASNAEDSKRNISEALKMVGNNSQLLETLMFIQARYHPPAQPHHDAEAAMAISQLISKNDFPAASKQIAGLAGKDKDAALFQLGHAEAEAGQYNLAYATMNDISDPVIHTSGLIQLIPQK